MRRVAPAVVLLALWWVLLGSNGVAQIYPPTPQSRAGPAPVVSPVVVVRGAPAAPARALSRAGSDTVPLLFVATGSALLGLVLIRLTRTRHHLLP